MIFTHANWDQIATPLLWQRVTPLAQGVNDCLKHKALERQAQNDNELSDQPKVLNANMIQMQWISIFLIDMHTIKY